MFDSLWPRGLQHTRPSCPSLSPWVCSNSCPLSQWCYPIISNSAPPVSLCLQSFPPSGSFPVGWLFPSGGQNIGASASASALPMNIQDWFPLGLTGLISLMSKGLSESSQHHNSKASILLAQPSLWSKSYICMWLFGKTIAFTLTYGISNVFFHIASYI